MKDYRIREVIRKNSTWFNIQTFSWFSGWSDIKRKYDGGLSYHTLKKAQSVIQEMRDRKVTGTKYHY